MLKAIGISHWIAALVLCASVASAALAEQLSSTPEDTRAAVISEIQQTVIQLAMLQVEEESDLEPGSEPPEPLTPTEAPAGNLRRGGSIVRFGDDYEVRVNESVEELVIFGGAVTIHGEVEGDLAVIGGSAEISETGIVRGDFVVIGGSLTILPGATADGDIVVIGGALNSAPGFTPGGEQVVAGNILGGADFLAAAVPWVSRGLFWGRPIVPELAWIWVVVGVLLALYLGLNFLFDGAVSACVQALGRKPLTTFLVGLLVLLLIGPASFILMISVIGFAIVPFLWAALAAAGTLGGVAVSRWMGETVIRPDGPGNRLQSAGALLIGFAIIVLALMVPVVGFVASASLGVFAVGAASISLIEGLRHENPNLADPPPPSPGGGISGEPQAGAPQEGTPTAEPMFTESTPLSAQSTPTGAATGPPDPALHPRATFLIRAGAFVLDVLLVAMLNGILVFSNGGAFFLLLLAYHIAFWSWKTTTVGGIICQLRVVRTDGQALRFTDACVRGLSSIFSAVVLGLGWFWVLKDPERQSWHDKIAGTYVVTVPRDHPLP